jgi:hypothetical protein
MLQLGPATGAKGQVRAIFLAATGTPHRGLDSPSPMDVSVKMDGRAVNHAFVRTLTDWIELTPPE